MKKLLIMAAATMTAGLLHSATVSWDSVMMRAAENGNGGWSSSVWVKDNLYGSSDLAVYVYLVEQAEYNAAASLTQREMYDTYYVGKGTGTDIPQGHTTSGYSVSAETPAVVGAEDDYYAIVIYTYQDARFTDSVTGQPYDMYIATRATIDNDDITSDKDIPYPVSVFGDASSASWSAVPEPTSGLLLLVGGALLALKRKRA